MRWVLSEIPVTADVEVAVDRARASGRRASRPGRPVGVAAGVGGRPGAGLGIACHQRRVSLPGHHSTGRREGLPPVGGTPVAAQGVAHDPGERGAGDRAATAVDLRRVDHDVDGEAGVVGRREAAEGDRRGAVVAAARRRRRAGRCRSCRRRGSRGPGARGATPASSSTTRSIIRAVCRAACSLTTRVASVAASVPTTVPSSVVARALDDARRDADAAVGDRVDGRGHLDRVDRDATGRRRRGPWSGRSSRRRRSGCPGDSPRTPMSVRWPRPKVVQVADELERRERVGGEHGADVGRLGDDAGQRELDVAVVEPVADDAVLARAATAGPGASCRGVTLPASISAAAVSTFSTEPGS